MLDILALPGDAAISQVQRINARGGAIHLGRVNIQQIRHRAAQQHRLGHLEIRHTGIHPVVINRHGPVNATQQATGTDFAIPVMAAISRIQ